jgi:tRNA G18 (ribose-2'-O)-methylase SpoU
MEQTKKNTQPFSPRGFRQIEGRNAVREALRSGAKIVRIFFEIGGKADEKLKEIHDLAVDKNIPIEKIIGKSG